MKKTQLAVIILLAFGFSATLISEIVQTHKMAELQQKYEAQLKANEKLHLKNLEVTKDNYESIKQLEKLQEELRKSKEQNKDINSKYDKVKGEIDRMLEKVSFNPNNVTEPSNATEYHMKKALKGTALSKESASFIEAEKKYKVNALFLAGIVANESSWGTSNRAVSQNNLSGYAVYNDGAKGAYFDSWRESILETAKLLSKDYLNSKGKYYNGKSITDINTFYCQVDGQPDFSWTGIVGTIANDFKNKINS